jgi:hypothetical protein
MDKPRFARDRDPILVICFRNRRRCCRCGLGFGRGVLRRLWRRRSGVGWEGLRLRRILSLLLRCGISGRRMVNMSRRRLIDLARTQSEEAQEGEGKRQFHRRLRCLSVLIQCPKTDNGLLPARHVRRPLGSFKHLLRTRLAFRDELRRRTQKIQFQAGLLPN